MMTNNMLRHLRDIIKTKIFVWGLCVHVVQECDDKSGRCLHVCLLL